MNVADSVELIDDILFAQAGRPEHYPKAVRREWTNRGLAVVDAGPTEGLGPHPTIVLHFDGGREVVEVGVAREGALFKKDGFAGEERGLLLIEAMARARAILRAEREKHPVGAGWSINTPVRIFVNGRLVFVPHRTGAPSETRWAISAPNGVDVVFKGEVQTFEGVWCFNEADEYLVGGPEGKSTTIELGDVVTEDDEIESVGDWTPGDPDSWKA